MATLAVGLGSDALKIGLSQLLGHSVRLKDATNENTAASSAIPAFTQDIKDVVAAFNAGSYDGAQAAAFIQQQEQAIYAFLKKQVGPAGTAWTEGGTCNKTCTVGCCLFYYFVAPVTIDLVAKLQGKNFPINITPPPTYPSKYGYKGQPGFTLTLNPPKTSALSQLFSGNGSTAAPTATAGVAANVTGAANSVLSKVGISVSPTMLAVIGIGLIAILAFSQRGGQ